MQDTINFQEKLGKISETWSPRIIAQMNDYHFKVAKLEGEFIWHKHDETDEVFIILDGSLELHYRDRVVNLQSGEMVVVPKGVEHKPYAASLCSVLLVEPAGTLNTGDAGGEHTILNPEWV